MPRTTTSAINDLIRLIGELKKIDVDWEIPVEREGWECKVSVSIYRWDAGDPGLSISVHSFGHLKESFDSGMAFYTALQGQAAPGRLTRRWFDTVLVDAVETAKLAALSFTVDDLRPLGSHEPLDLDDYRQKRAYFESTLR
jgi:hypothetical protein